MTSTTKQTVDLNTCALCLGSEDDVEKYGKFFRCSIQELAVHEYCLFFASGLAQNGEDHEGFDGFLHKDIKDEIKRASKLRCTSCHKKGAAVGCCVLKCGSSFHFVCGLQKHAMFHFFDSFRAFCKKHRPTQKILPSDSDSIQSPTCPICLNDVDISDRFYTLKSPCCKNAWFHRSCIQKQALANGMYYFRCAFCNNFDEFQEEMKQMGIYIPDRDAIWEQGDAYVELLHQHNRCDAQNCVCPKGREFSGTHKSQRWKIYKCFACGQSGTHRWCQQPQMTRRFFCQNCVVCFPQHEQAARENRPLDDSQSTTSSSQNSETSQELNASIDMENTPLSQLMDHFKTQINTSNCEDRCDSNTGSEKTSSIKSGFSCEEKDVICHLDDYTTIESSDGSGYVDIESLSTTSSCTLSIGSDASSLVADSKVKPKEKKRKAVTNQKTAGRRKTKTKSLKTKAQRRAKKEERKNKAQQQVKPNMKKNMSNNAETSTKSITMNGDSNENANESIFLLNPEPDSQDREAQQRVKPKMKKNMSNNAETSTKSITKNSDSNKNANDSFFLLLSPEPDSQEKDLKTKSPNKNEEIPLLSLDEDCSGKCNLNGLSSNTSFHELISITSGKESFSVEEIAKDKTESPLESEFQVASISAMSTPSKSSDGSEMSVRSGKKKLLQRDIRSMFTSQNNDSTSLGKSPVKVVDDQGCQTEPMKIRRGNKRRKLSASLSEYKSITTFMSVNDSSPKRKSPKEKLQCTNLNSILPNNEMETTAASTVSNSIMETMTAAKGMVIRALKRLGGTSDLSTETDAATPRKSLFRDTDSSNDESCKSGPSDERHTADDVLPLSTTTRKCIEDTDSDSSDSIKVVKIKKGRSPTRPRDIPNTIQLCSVPNYIHEKFCACYKIHGQQRSMPKRTSKPADPSEVIVIDDENDDQDSGKGSSRDTSDAGTKSGDGSSPEDKKSYPCDEENDGSNNCYQYYSSSEELISYDADDRINDIDNSQSLARNADRCSSFKTVSTETRKKTKRNGKKSSKKSKSKVKKRADYGKHFCPSSNSDQLDVSQTNLSKESLGDSYFEKRFKEHVDRDCLMDECTENNFKGDFEKKGKSHGSKKAQGQSNLSPLTQKTKSNLTSKKTQPKELHTKKKFLNLKKYMECSDEDFQSKKKRKRQKSGTRDKLGNSSCTSTVTDYAL